MSDVFREVDEDLRRERLKEVWNRYGIILVLAAVLVVVAVAVFVFLDSRGQQQQAALAPAASPFRSRSSAA